MPTKKISSRELRKIAESFVDSLPNEIGRPELDRDDFITSLVRQWVTYDHRASFFPDEHRQVYADIIRSPLGNVRVGILPVSTAGWMKWLIRDWKIGSEEMAEVVGQLNRAQSAEIVNADGLQLRIWVNPKDRSHGIEPVSWEDIPPSTTPDYPTVAANVLEAHLGREGLGRDEIVEIAKGVAKQWQQHDGHACVFLDLRRVLALRFSLDKDGICRIGDRSLNVDLVRHLTGLGVPPGEVSDVLEQINRGEEVEFRDRNGAHLRLFHDPKASRFWVEPLDGVPRRERPASPPVVCPKCTAVLARWDDGIRQQACRFCGHAVVLS